MTKQIFTWIAIAITIFTLYNAFGKNINPKPSIEMPYSSFVSSVRKGEVSEAIIQGERIRGILKNGHRFETYQPTIGNNGSVIEEIIESGAQIKVIPKEGSGIFAWIGPLLPFVLMIGLWIFIMSRMNKKNGSVFSFGKSKAKLLNESSDPKTFKDVAGIDEARGELEEIVDFLKDAGKFIRLGGKIPKGALLVGPPGTGKTLLARAIAGEADVPFFSISGSDFVEMFVGVGASRVRDMFEQAKKNSPCILFIDEIDAVGRHRGIGHGGGSDEREQTLNQLLVEMDGFEPNEGVILIAATNRPDVLDPALLRPGRFDRQITVPNPDLGGREKILQVHVRGVKAAPDVNLQVIARGTPGFSGADLANLVNEAALLAARLNKQFVTMEDFEAAKDRVMMGIERRSLIMTDEEKRLTAYHEAGHAIVALNTEASDPIHKATIIPRGGALGLVLSLPERDHLSMTRNQLESKIAMAMGGRAAEELIFDAGHVTSGASSDIQQVTAIARAMVTQYGMSDSLGTIDYTGDTGSFRYPGAMTSPSEDSQRQIDSEIRKLVDTGHVLATKILKENKKDLETLAQGLLEWETLSGEDIHNLLEGKPLKRNEPEEESISTTSIPKSGKKRSGRTPDPEITEDSQEKE